MRFEFSLKLPQSRSILFNYLILSTNSHIYKLIRVFQRQMFRVIIKNSIELPCVYVRVFLRIWINKWVNQKNIFIFIERTSNTFI